MRFGSGKNERLPAPKTGGLYKTNCNQLARISHERSTDFCPQLFGGGF
jgi:hypothetical protein